MKRALDAEKATLIELATALAADGHRSELPELLKTMFARCPAEDLVPYVPTELLGFAESALAGLMLRVPGIHHIRIYNPPWSEGGDPRKAITIVEIVNDDMPFLLDSVMQELTDAGLEVRLMVHPILTVVRGMTGRLLSLGDRRDPDAARESFIHIHIGRLPDPIAAEELEARIDGVLTEVRAAVDDWPRMKARVEAAIGAYGRLPLSLPPETVEESIAFLKWLLDDNFTFLGLRDFEVSLDDAADAHLTVLPSSGLGLLRDPGVRVLRRGREFVQVTPEVREFMTAPEALIVAKANVKARVHRHAYLDYVGVKQFDDGGRLISEMRLLGLFTSSAYNGPTAGIPFLRRKVEAVMRRVGFEPGSHSGRALAHILENFPRDELFQIDVDTLQDFAGAILELGERPRIRVLARREKFDRFVSVLVYAPRDRFSTENRQRIGAALADAFAGRVSSVYPSFPEGPLARVHYIIGRDEGATPDVPQPMLEAVVAAIIRTWDDDFADACRAKFGPARGRSLIEAYGPAFSGAYKASYPPAAAVDDIGALELFAGSRTAAVILKGEAAPSSRLSLRLFNRGGPVPLTRRVPLLEDMGFTVLEEKTFEISRPGGAIVLHDMAVERTDGRLVDLARDDDRLRALFMAVWLGRADSDRLNALAVSAGLGWREIAVLRALARYLQQLGISYGQRYIAEALTANPALAAALLARFHARFDPGVAGDREVAEATAAAAVGEQLNAVRSLDEDRILRRIDNLIAAALRTSFYQIGADGAPHAVIAFKFDPDRVDGMPAPRPHAEIFLHSPAVEGVHLRFGKVARGGLRWSDRPQDFRTEILGLAKAQRIKNAVIVPVGAKGGFVPRRLAPAMSRDDVQREGVNAYRLFVSTLIDLTDNIVDGEVVPPAHMVRHDGDDPYLVVAADKGTASFSDIANAIAEAAGFWLGDAFASGGSAGYDHKKMGITARGAFEAVKRHFREMNVDVMAAPFTAAGVGDMSGDVFGNGMLLSPQTRLVAAFDHRHIFIDPSPDPVAALAERRRLFAMEKSSWADYAPATISPGGGVYARNLKAVALSAEARTMLGFDRTTATPDEVISAILRAPVDLLWFGGIGTYVRADGETDAEVGDRANDAVRVVAGELRARVVGEGANLAMTQRARVAYNLAGGRCNSDAVDNSAGVNTSDVEVNIKIALATAMKAGRLDRAARDGLLADMTVDVARLVLDNNYRQTLSISVSRHRGRAEFAQMRRLIGLLEAEGRLDRGIEALPSDDALTRRLADGAGLTRAEIGVLTAHAKLALFDVLLATDIVDTPASAHVLADYFPPAMRQAFAADIAGHRLHREIVATRLANAIVNAGGPGFVTAVAEEAGTSAADAVRACLVASAVLDHPAIEAMIDALDGRIDGAVQLDLYASLRRHLAAASLWIAENGMAGGPLADAIARLGEGLARYRAAAAREAVAAPPAGVPAALAGRLDALASEIAAFDVILVAEQSGRPAESVAPVIAAVAGLFGLASLNEAAAAFQPADIYEIRATDLARRTLARARRALVVRALAEGGADAFAAGHGEALADLRRSLAELVAGQPSVAKLTVAAGLLEDFAR